MKYFFIIALMFFSIANAQSFLEADYNFIDSAFDGIKPVTNKEFDDTINRLTPQPIENTFMGRLKAFLFGRKYGVENPPANAKNSDEKFEAASDSELIKNLTQGVSYIRLSVAIIGNQGSIIPCGDYKIFEKKVDNQSLLFFYQGHKEYGSLKLRDFEDIKQDEKNVAYSRVDILSEDIIRIVYSTISDTKCALAKVYLQN